MQSELQSANGHLLPQQQFAPGTVRQPGSHAAMQPELQSANGHLLGLPALPPFPVPQAHSASARAPMLGMQTTLEHLAGLSGPHPAHMLQHHPWAQQQAFQQEYAEHNLYH